MDPLDLAKLQEWIRRGRVVPNADGVITVKEIADSNIVGRVKHGVKLLANPRVPFTENVTIHVSRASHTAIAAVEAAGGHVMTVYHNRLALRALLHPSKFGVLPRSARPKPKIAPYYRSFENRGFLSPEMQLLSQAKQALPEDMQNATPTQVHELIYPSSK
jgi:large subunit ribosomal protein L15